MRSTVSNKSVSVMIKYYDLIVGGFVMKVVASIEARMGSSRLPGKVLMKIQGKPILQLMIERLKFSKNMDSKIVATLKELNGLFFHKTIQNNVGD